MYMYMLAYAVYEGKAPVRLEPYTQSPAYTSHQTSHHDKRRESSNVQKSTR